MMDFWVKIRREFTRKICRTLAPMYTRKCVGHPIWVISHVESWSRMSIRRTVDTFFSYCGVEPATVERRRNVVSTQGLSHYSLAPELCDKLLPPPAVRQSNGGSPTVISNALSASNISSTGSEPVRNLLVVKWFRLSIYKNNSTRRGCCELTKWWLCDDGNNVQCRKKRLFG